MNRTKATTTNIGLLDARYLKLDCSNDPLTGTLTNAVVNPGVGYEVTQPSLATYQTILRGTTYGADIGDFNFVIDGTPSFLGLNDPSMFWGYNVGTQGQRVVLTEPTMHLGLESNYKVSPTDNWMEYYVQYISADGATNYRPFAFITSRVNHTTLIQYKATSFTISDEAGANHFYLIMLQML